jgi:hypothetical protein
MIDDYCYTPDWLTDKRKTYSKADPSIMEKVVYALALLQHLKATGLPFVFKGGTSLLILLPTPARFSVDIDIIVSPKLERERLESFLNLIKDFKVFTDVIIDDRRSYRENIPKAHYRFVYNSQLSKKPNEILLDVLFEENSYARCIERPIVSEWIRLTKDPILVTTPDINGISGDKLVAFAPSTVGVPYGKEKEREIIKQLFDVGMLYDMIDDVESLKVSYNRIAELEITYRGQLGLTVNDILDDTIQTGLILARREKQLNETDNAKFKELTTGIGQFGHFVFQGAFRIDHALLASAKAAVLAAIVKTDFKGTLPRFNEKMTLDSFEIKYPDYLFLNKKLKNIPGGALYYWSETIKLLH